MTPDADRFSGLIVGQCLGDALGFLVEGEAPHICARYAAEVVRPGRLPHQTREGYVFGQYSDESQMARELMESYVASGGFDPADYAKRIAALFSENRVVGRGRTTEQAARRLAQGVPWHQAGTPSPMAGNASAVRAGVIGLLQSAAPARLTEWACQQSIITHADPRCSAGAVAMARAVAMAAGNVPPEGFLAPLREATQQIEPSLATALKRLEELLPQPSAHASEVISRLGLPPGVDSQWRGGVSAFVVSSILWALYAFLKHPDSFTEAVALAIEAGGDVDSTAAMVGALVGARRGLSALPQDLAGRLNDGGNWRYHDLVTLARDCHEVASRGSGHA
jgi:ADP-ribosylglycohydrolase